MTDKDLDREKGCSPEMECSSSNGGSRVRVPQCASTNSNHVPRNRSQLGASANHNPTGVPRSKSDVIMMLNTYKNMVRDGKRAMVRMKRQNDSKLNSIISELMLLESRLRQEQSQFANQITSKDSTIMMQSQEIERLRRDNRRLIARMRKITEPECPASPESNSPSKGNVLESHDNDMKEEKSDMTIRNGSYKEGEGNNNQICETKNEVHNFVNLSELSLLASQYYDIKFDTIDDLSGMNAVKGSSGRVFHKPPIAEKPKLRRQTPETTVVTKDGKQCSIVSTISRLLEDESDQGVAVTSGSSEPSSPEATLKPTTPRVIRLARQYDKGIVTSIVYPSDQSRLDDSSIKSLIMDEYEVTSGYNSDAFSEQEHDYENMRVSVRNGSSGGEGDGESQDDDDENYVLLEAVHQDNDTTLLAPVTDDHPIYSNIEYQNGIESKTEDDDYETVTPRDSNPSTPEKQINPLLLETNLDNSDGSSDNTLSDSPRQAKNQPRSRDNIINVLNDMESDVESSQSLMQNFEEFTLDALDLEKEHADDHELRHSGDGAEAKNLYVQKDSVNVKEIPWHLFPSTASLVPGTNGYERFLEATGLSDKSILSPSRMLSNHRSMLKPRDIKHRDKLRSAFTNLTTLDEVPQGDNNSFAKFYTKEQVYL